MVSNHTDLVGYNKKMVNVKIYDRSTINRMIYMSGKCNKHDDIDDRYVRNYLFMEWEEINTMIYMSGMIYLWMIYMSGMTYLWNGRIDL